MPTVGPILQFLGQQGPDWGISLLVLTDMDDPPPNVRFAAPAVMSPLVSAPVPSTHLQAWRMDVAIAQAAQALAVDYTVNGQAHQLHVPAQGAAPNLGYVSCNGFSDPRAKKSVQRTPGPVVPLATPARRRPTGWTPPPTAPLHLLLMGGDQIYSDDMWTAVPELRAWSDLPWAQRISAPVHRLHCAALCKPTLPACTSTTGASPKRRPCSPACPA